ncbi:toprim domain-containing protein [Patescibacteria group bacterium]
MKKAGKILPKLCQLKNKGSKEGVITDCSLLTQETMTYENVEQYLSTTTIPYKLSSNKAEVMIQCLFCEDKKTHLYISNTEGCWLCHRCGARGSWWNLLEHFGDDSKPPLETLSKIEYKAKLASKISQAPLDSNLADQYHQKLPKRILNYLKGPRRGLKQETIDKFKIGWYQGAITIPIFDQKGNLINIRYRRDPNKVGGQKYWNTTSYGQARLFNLQAFKKARDYIVITEGEFDTMVLDQNDIPAVSGTCGCKTFPESWSSYFKDIKTVYLCFDTDPEGQEGAKKAASTLGRKVKIITLPHQGTQKADITDYFASHSVSEFKKLMRSAKELKPKKTGQDQTLSILGFEVSFKDLKNIILKKEGLTYKLRPYEEYRADTAVYSGDQYLNRDNLLLTSSKSRTTFCKQCRKANDQTRELVGNHLAEIPEVLDGLAKKQLDKNKKKEKKGLSKKEKQAAKKQLLSPTLLFDILQFIKKLCVAGEEKTALTHYIVFTSRITDDPLSVVVKGESSVGKSYVVDRVMQMFPKSEYRDITDATAQSFYYVRQDYFSHKIIVIFERHGTEKTDYSIRSLQSEKKLKLQVTIKDPETGQFMTTEKEVDGPVGFISTTTQARIHAENETRVLSLYPDETTHQTRRILEISDLKYRGISGPTKEEIKKWRNLQRILKPYPVLIPFVEEIRKAFPKKPVRVRRDYTKFLSLLTVITLLHQEQREKQELDKKVCLLTSLADFYLAKILFEEMLQKTIFEIPPKSEKLIKVAQALTIGTSGSFSIRELANKASWDYDTAWKWFRPAYQKSFFVKTEDHKGSKAARYKLTGQRIEEKKILPETANLYEKNKLWLGGTTIYHPITGEILKFKKQKPKTIDVPTTTKET